jgi:hypothetical protein
MTFTPDDDACKRQAYQFAERRHPDASSITILSRRSTPWL